MKPTQDPSTALQAKQMAHMLGNCKTCAHASDTHDSCKQGRPEFQQRFEKQCIHREHDSGWCR